VCIFGRDSHPFHLPVKEIPKFFFAPIITIFKVGLPLNMIFVILPIQEIVL
jgi:hypothetical protein